MSEPFEMLLFLWITVLAIGIAAGFTCSLDHSVSCTEPASRMSIPFPGFQLGCWLGKPLR